MEYFTLLGGATLVIAALAAALYAQHRDAGLVVGIAALYYWSLYGAWSIVIDKPGDSAVSTINIWNRKCSPFR